MAPFRRVRSKKVKHVRCLLVQMLSVVINLDGFLDRELLTMSFIILA